MDDFKGMKFMRLDKRVAELADADILRDIRNRKGYHKSKTQFHVDYVNLTDKTLYVKNRMGIIEVIEPELFLQDIRLFTVNDFDKRGVVVYIEMTMTLTSAMATMRSLKDHTDKSALSSALYDKVKLAYNRLLKMKDNGYGQRIGECSTQVELYYFIHESTLSGDDKHFSELDVTFSLYEKGEEVTVVEHPNTQDKLLGGRESGVDYWHKENGRGDKSLTLSLAVVDQTGAKTVDDRYIHLLGKVYKVPIIYKSPIGNKRFVGLTVERNYSSLNPSGERTEEHEVLEYSLEEASNNFGLSRTVETAHESMDPRKKIDRERERFELENHFRKMELEESRDELAKSKHALEEAKVKIESSQLEIRAITEKYKLDSALIRSKTERREASLKEFGIVLSTASALVAMVTFAYGKLSGSSGGDFSKMVAMPKGI